MSEGTVLESNSDMKSERIQRKRIKVQGAQERLSEVPGWSISEGELVRKYRLSSHRAAVAFAAFVSETAQDLARSPRILISGSDVDVRTRTEEVDGLSESDFDLVGWIDSRRSGL